jgi:hypothetical protein
VAKPLPATPSRNAQPIDRAPQRDRTAPLADPALRNEIARLDKLSTMLDSQYRVPGTSLRFGWDTILGLVPGIGDAVTFVPSAYLIYRAHKLGARKRTIGKMAFNSGLDATLGAVPLLGDAFDLLYKANNRNFALLRAELEGPLAARSAARQASSEASAEASRHAANSQHEPKLHKPPMRG